jgi:hypothetical protein
LRLSVRARHVLTFLSFVAMFAGCADGEGTLVVRIYGEDFVEQGIAADEMDDGWAVTFDRFDVSVDDLTVAGTSFPVAGPVDLTPASVGRGHELGRAEVAPGSHDDARFTISRVVVEGEATLDDVRKHFALTFDHAVTYSGCETSVHVEHGRETTFEVTIHADHLFFDSRAATRPGLRFQALADADTDEDGEITQAELASADLGDYDPGSDGGHLQSLWDYLVALVAEIAHADGEAHCIATPAAG